MHNSLITDTTWSRQQFVVMSLPTFLNHVEWMRLSISSKMIQKSPLFRFRWNVIWRFQWFFLLQWFIQHLIPYRRILYINHVVIIYPRFTFRCNDLFNHWYVPVINLRRFSITLKTNWEFLVWLYNGVWFIVDIVMWIRREFDDEHVRIIRSAVMSWFNRNTFALMIVWGSDTG